MKVDVPTISDFIKRSSRKGFSLSVLKQAYEYAIEDRDQLVIYIVGLKGAGKTSLGIKILEEIGLPIDLSYIARTLPQYYLLYKRILQSAKEGNNLPYAFFDDVGNIADKWGASSRIHKILYKITNLDRPLVPLVILTDTFSLAKHMRSLARLIVVCQKIDRIHSLATFYIPYYNIARESFGKRRIGRIIYKHLLPKWLRNEIDEARIEEIQDLLNELKEEIIFRYSSSRDLLKYFDGDE